MNLIDYPASVPKWGVYELSIKGPAEGNPYMEHWVKAGFEGRNEKIKVDGFYDGEGVYRVRFMPSFEGEYTAVITSDFGAQAEVNFMVTQPEEGNHGPMRVMNNYHFAYEDGTPYFSIGTTCYAWVFQKEELRRQTLLQLKDSAFNKIRFCLTPKHYIHNLVDPVTFPYEGTPIDRSHITEENFVTGDWPYDYDNHFDYTRLNPKHFQLLDEAICGLGKLGIEADLIVMHPYDCWGFSKMTRQQDDLYWNYVVARFAAYHNVWWSLANEWDLLTEKTVDDWEHYAQILIDKDPYRHLRGIHNCMRVYDHTRPWITHCSMQRTDLYKTTEMVSEYRIRYGKPVVMDEVAYEGNIEQGWGNITGEEMIRRFWEGICNGGYVGHGETYIDPEDILWWSHGGKLHGTSNERLKFLAEFAKTLPKGGLKPVKMAWDASCAVPEDEMPFGQGSPSLILMYLGFNRPSFRQWVLPEGSYQIDIIDTWNMTIESAGIFKGFSHIELPGKQYIALCAHRIDIV
ncbi:DUF5605 domain-containing protein [Parablautia intestinalis]|jgi:hypothetical protein|uniref:DUF5605 domain-containing protein n=1 Tax=Parablautia intestinalis TaxID=2320100 RepID=UPI00256F197B|nr:DUF5605 domain-containing protein [Parablautia intestinalis]